VTAAAGVDPISGPFLLAAVTFGAAWLVLALGLPRVAPPGSTARPETSTGGAAWTPDALLALVALVAGQVVMVLVMTMTPIHIRSGGEGLASIGIVIASHTFGMYALSPISGWLTDRFGRLPMLLASVVLLAGSSLLAAAARVGTPWLAVALFLLGLGWNFSFVAGSALLTESVPEAWRVHLQGYADSAVWLAAALAGGASGLLLESIGYASLGRLAAGLALVPLLALAATRLGGGGRRAALAKAP
jgi:MFS family permease